MVEFETLDCVIAFPEYVISKFPAKLPLIYQFPPVARGFPPVVHRWPLMEFWITFPTGGHVLTIHGHWWVRWSCHGHRWDAMESQYGIYLPVDYSYFSMQSFSMKFYCLGGPCSKTRNQSDQFALFFCIICSFIIVIRLKPFESTTSYNWELLKCRKTGQPNLTGFTFLSMCLANNKIA